MDRNRTTADATSSAAPESLTRRDALAGLASGLLMPSLATASRVTPVPSSRMEADGALHYASLTDVARLIESGKLSPTDLTRQQLVPCGFSAEGLPLSVQFVGRRLSEAVLCRAGHAFERVTEWHFRRPPV